MAAIERFVVVPYSAELMFDLVDRIESYPDFLPWCSDAKVERNGESVVATVTVAYSGIRHGFRTRNRHVRSELIEISLDEGPFSNLNGKWRFTDISDGRSKISFNLEYEFSNPVFEKLLGKVFGYIYEHMVDSFIERAHQVYGFGEKRSEHIG